MKSFYFSVLLFLIVSFSHSQETLANSMSTDMGVDSSNAKAPPPPPVFSELFFSYDAAGNQVQRFYCPTGDNCTIPDPPKTPVPNIVDKLAEIENEDSKELERISIYPNPTIGEITLKVTEFNIVHKKLIEAVIIYDSKGQLVFENSKLKTSEISFDFRSKPSGIYLIHIHFNDNSYTSKQIIKK